jgi:hypothetical protein
VQVHDLSRLERELGIPLAGLIGLDVLSKASFRLDYENKKIEFADLSHKGIPVPFEARTSLAVVTVTFGSNRGILCVRHCPCRATLQEAKAYFIQGSKDSAFDGLLGVRALGFRAVSYDQTKRILYLQK